MHREGAQCRSPLHVHEGMQTPEWTAGLKPLHMGTVPQTCYRADVDDTDLYEFLSRCKNAIENVPVVSSILVAVVVVLT